MRMRKDDAEQALQLTAKFDGHPRAHAEAQRALGSALLAMGQTHRAFEQLNLAHEAYKLLGDMASAARTKLDIGMAQRSLGQLDDAEISYTQALELWEATGNLAWQANLLNNLGVLQHVRGDYLPAAHSLERAVECARLSSYPRMEAFALAGLGDLYRDLEAYNESTEAYRQAAALAERTEERYLLFYLDLARGVLARRQKRFPTARELLQAASQRAQAGLAEIDRAFCHLEQASLLLVQGDFQAVAGELSEAAAFFASQGRRLESARSQMILMLAAAGCEDWEAAQIHRERAGGNMGFPERVAAAGFIRARVFAAAGKNTQPAGSGASGRAPAAPGGAARTGACRDIAASCVLKRGLCRWARRILPSRPWGGWRCASTGF